MKSQPLVQEDGEEEEYQNQNAFCFQFTEVGERNRQVGKLGVATRDTAHMVVSPGLNLSGTCKNKDCKVFNQIVWIKKGFGSFRINEEVNDSECPICHKQVPSDTIKTLGYTKANVKVVSKKCGEPKSIWFDKQTEGDFVKFEGYGKTVQYEILILDVTKL